MELENVKEYEYTRKETEFIRECITTYMGFVVGGSGAAMFGLAALRVFGTDNVIVMSYVAYATSVIVALVMAVLFYKFNSHNRYAAYARVLADEHYPLPPSREGAHEATHVAWELCMARIRMVDHSPDEFRDIVKDLDFVKNRLPEERHHIDGVLRNHIRDLNELSPRIDVGKTRKGLRHLGMALRGKTRTTSWAYPPGVVAVFFLLIVIYLLIGSYGLYVSVEPVLIAQKPITRPHVMLIVSGLLVMAAQVLIWHVLAGKLFTLLEGSATVDSFSFRFMLARAIYLARIGVNPRYPAIEQLMRHEYESRPTAVEAEGL